MPCSFFDNRKQDYSPPLIEILEYLMFFLK